MPFQSRVFALVVLIATAGVHGQQPAMHVWAVGDSFRIDATTGKAFDTNALIFPDSSSGDYRRSG